MISGPASPMSPSWNQVVGFLTDWQGFGGWRPAAQGIGASCSGSRCLDGALRFRAISVVPTSRCQCDRFPDCVEIWDDDAPSFDYGFRTAAQM